MSVFRYAVPHWLSAVVIGMPVVLIGGAIALHRHDEKLLENAKTEEHVTSLDSVIEAFGARKLTADTVYRTTVERYREAERNILADSSRVVIPRAEVVKLAGSCRETQLTCERRAAIADSLSDSLRAEVKVLKAWKAPAPPRLSYFAEGLYDYLGKTPVARAGVELRIAGPVSLSAAIDGSKPNQKYETRALIGARITFH